MNLCPTPAPTTAMVDKKSIEIAGDGRFGFRINLPGPSCFAACGYHGASL